MNSTELDTFITVAEVASTSTAAQQLHVSQPAVTRRIQALESALNTPLFDRVGKRLQLNQAGRLFLPQAQAILQAWQSARQQLSDLADSVTGVLNLATSHHIGLHRLAPVLHTYRDRFPEVEMNITFEDSEVAHDMVREGKIELAVATLDPRGSADLNSTQIWHDPLVFMAKQGWQASMAELAEHPCVIPGTATYTGRIVVERFQQAGIKLRPEMSTNYLETIHMLVGVGIGWSVLPLSMRGELEEIEVTDLGQPMYRNLGVVTHPERQLSNAASAFLEALGLYADGSPT